MRRAQDSAITRRDDHLARTRRISIWIIGWASAASLALATAFGFALPGHALLSGQTGNSSGGGSSGGSGGQIAPPQQPPGGTVAPPVVSSGGS